MTRKTNRSAAPVANAMMTLILALAVGLTFLAPGTWMADRANAASPAVDGVVYGTINMTYADFYYGELNRIEPKLTGLTAAETTADFNAAAKSADGYDAVTSATTSKFKMYNAAYYEDYTVDAPADTKWSEPDHLAGKILGVKAVQIAVPEALYNDILQKTEAGTSCSNGLADTVKNMSVSDTAFSEYKVLRSDGTFSAMKSEQTTAATSGDNAVAASITTDSPWGTHQIDFNWGSSAPKADDILGILLETSDGTIAGMQHGDNIWVNVNEISFAVKDGFVEPHKNIVNYKNAQALQGKTITKITYLLKNQADVVIPCNLKVKTLLGDEASIQAEKTEFAAGDTVATKLLFNGLPEDAQYTVASVTPATGTALEATGYTYDRNSHTLMITNRQAGNNTVLMQDQTGEYEDVELTLTLQSSLKESAFALQNGKLTIQKGSSNEVENYLANVTKLSVNGTAITNRHGSPASVIFKNDGSINWEATTGRGAAAKPVFTDGESGMYTIQMSAAGYPDVSLSTAKSVQSVTLSKTKYTYTGKNLRPAVSVKDTAGKKVDAAYYTVTYPNASKLPGTYQVKVAMKAPYTGSKTLTFIIAPKATRVTLSKATKSSLTAQWKAAAGVTKYQVQYSTKKNMKGARTKEVSAKKTKLTIKKLKKGKKYYVRVRSAKNKIYSAWSPVKSLNTKKK